MTYDQFWNQDVELVKAYREADKIKRDLKNQDMWMQGAYYYEALLDAAPVLRFSLSCTLGSGKRRIVEKSS